MKIDMQYGKDETKVTVERIMNTFYDDETSWIEYSSPIGLGYEITTEYKEGEECKVQIDSETKGIEKLLNNTVLIDVI